MKTVQQAINTLKEALKPLYDSFEAEAITNLIIGEVTGFSNAKLKAFGDAELSGDQQAQTLAILEKVKTGMPVQYALGHTEFYGLDFKVNSSVLIPRPETEELVSWIIESVKDKDISILDIGTGSGCIAISLKHELKSVNVSAIDISVEALKAAKENAAFNETDVRFMEADILNHDTLKFDAQFDVIVSNPPYVTQTDKLQMHSNVTNFEPHTALFVADEDPLIFYISIADFALKNLKTNGLLFFEINESYAQQTMQMLADKSFINIELRKDIRGKDRMVRATFFRQ